jgi:WD40 repeat protein
MLWDAGSGSIIRQIGADGNGHTGPVRAVAFSLDGRKILSGSADQTVIVWDATSGQEITRFTGHTDLVTAVAFSPDGRRAASGTRRSTLALWDAETGNIIRIHGRRSISKNRPAASCRRLLRTRPTAVWVNHGGGIMWDEATERPRRVSVFERDIEQTGGALSAVAFSPDGRFALVGEEESRIGLWNLETSQRILQFSAGVGVIGGTHQGKVTALTFGGGRFAVSGGEDNAVVLGHRAPS